MMKSRILAAHLLLLVGTGCLLVGCAGPDRPATYPVRGKVAYKGKPVAGASVAFLAQGASRPAFAETDETGEFRLTTFDPNDGAVAGIHSVTVTKLSATPAPLPPSVEPSPDEEVDPEAVEKAMQEHIKRLKTSRSLLPEKYSSYGTSNLQYEVIAGENEFNIELVD